MGLGSDNTLLFAGMYQIKMPKNKEQTFPAINSVLSKRMIVSELSPRAESLMTHRCVALIAHVVAAVLFLYWTSILL